MIANFCRLFVLSLVFSASVSAQEAPASPTPAPTATPSPAPTPEVTPVSDSSVSARSLVLELAGAFANDGYKVRDGFWSGQLEPGKPKLIEVNLFAGNEYWFSAVALPPAGEIEIKVFDEVGRQIETLKYEDGLKVAAGVEPQSSGEYFVQIQLLKGESAEFCLIYSYK